MRHYLLLFIIGFLFSCTNKKENTSKLTIKLPEKKMSSLTFPNSNQTSLWGFNSVESLNGVDCYLVYVQGPDLEPGECRSLDGTHILGLSKIFGLFKQGEEISFEVNSGSNRTIGLMGLTSKDGQCQQALGTNFSSLNYSMPMNLGSTTQDLNPGDNLVTIYLSATTAKSVESCQGQWFADLPNQTWPACKQSVSGLSYNSGKININGSCLSDVSKLDIVDETSSEKHPLEISSKTGKLIVSALTKNLQIHSNHIYKILITNAYGQVALPFTLSLPDGSVPVQALSPGSSEGQVVAYNSSTGKAEWRSLTAGSGNSNPGSQQKTVYFKDGTTTIGTVVYFYRTANYNVFNISSRAIPPLANGANYGASTNYYQPDKNGPAYLGSGGVYKLSPFNPAILEVSAVQYLNGPYFSNQYCTGDLIFSQYEEPIPPILATDIFPVKTFPIFTACESNGTGTNSANCTGLIYKKFKLENLVIVPPLVNGSSSATTLNYSQISFDSTRTDLAATHGFYCQSVQLSSSGKSFYRLSNDTANVVNVEASDFPGVVNDPQVSY